MTIPLRATQTGHSADVQMQLHVNGLILSIGQLGPEFIILDHPLDHPPTSAGIRLCIDGRETRWAVHLPNGISHDDQRVSISRIDRP